MGSQGGRDILNIMNNPRLIFAVVSTIIEECLIAVAVLWGLPQINVDIPVWVMVLVMILWLAYSVYTFRKGTKALNVGHIIGLPNMVGTRGKTVGTLDPSGWVRIRGELWSALSVNGEIQSEKEIEVVGQLRLKLEVREREKTGQPDS